MGSPNDKQVRVRFPTLETFALRSEGALATRTLRVVPDEIVRGPGRGNGRLVPNRRTFKGRGTPGVSLRRLEF